MEIVSDEDLFITQSSYSNKSLVHTILINKLSMYKINPLVVNWICDFLSNRHKRVKFAKD